MLTGALGLLLLPPGGGCRPHPAASPPLLPRSSLLTYHLPVPLGLPRPPSLAPGPRGRQAADPAAGRARLVRLARAELGRPAPGLGSLGALAFVQRIYRAAGTPLATAELPDIPGLRTCLATQGHLRGPRAPLPGDIAFFDQTHDANDNGELDDPLTHVALVERVEEDGTVHLIQAQQGRVGRLRLSLSQPHLRRAGDKELNSYLRTPKRADPERTPYLAGEMLAGFGTFLL
ncbi:MAG: CHAP domain-containing protein [Myxococcota bacterium]|nr:CHAP domain-containing protein [Myxococcota bacterium]